MVLLIMLCSKTEDLPAILKVFLLEYFQSLLSGKTGVG